MTDESELNVNLSYLEHVTIQLATALCGMISFAQGVNYCIARLCCIDRILCF